MSLDKILEEVRAERARQDAKWGEQNWCSLRTPTYSVSSNLEYGIISEERAKEICQTRFKNGVGCWADIFIEEVAESINTSNIQDLRMELIQTIAVACAWVESIDRNGK
jgi:hypothetical protein